MRYLILLVLGFGTYWVVLDVWKILDTRMHVIVCDVGQGDMILIKKSSVEIVVDWGPSPVKARNCLDRHLSFFDRNIELGVNSHPQKDHLAGIRAVLGRYRVASFAFSGEKGGQEFENVWRDMEKEGTRMLVVSSGDRIRVADISMLVHWPKSDPGSVKDINLLSVVLSLNYKSFDIFLSGDMAIENELAVIDSGLLTNVEVLKVAHHGSKTSSSTEILGALKPSLAVISAGKNNSYGHPHDLVLSRLDVFGSSVLRTDTNGEVEIITDGNRWHTKSQR